MIKIKSILYLLSNLKLTIKVILSLRKEEQKVQCLCDNIDTDDDLRATSIAAGLQILRIVTINKEINQLENGSSLLLGIFSINKNFPNKPIRTKAGQTPSFFIENSVIKNYILRDFKPLPTSPYQGRSLH